MCLQRWHGWCHIKLLPSRRVLCTRYNHAPCDFMQSHIHKVYACLAVTCQLHFSQNGSDLLRATRGCSGYQNKSYHRKLTREKKIKNKINTALLPGLELNPVIFWSATELSPRHEYTVRMSDISVFLVNKESATWLTLLTVVKTRQSNVMLAVDVTSSKLIVLVSAPICTTVGYTVQQIRNKVHCSN